MKVFYKNLNSVRFIAAALVIVHHIEQYRGFDNLSNFFFPATQYPVTSLIGKLGVCIFFVLSGFLITSLLVLEKEKYQRIDIKKFYIRRILRIWPLYFLIAFLGFFVWPHIPGLQIPVLANVHEHFWTSLLLVIFFLPNIQLMLYHVIPYQGQSWSVGVEEQFYLVWPLIMNATKNRQHFKRVLMWLLGGYIAFKLVSFGLPLLTGRFIFLSKFHDYSAFIFQIDVMMIGGLFAMFNFEDDAKQFVTQKWVQVSAYVSVIFLTAMGWHFQGFFWEIHGLLWAIIIVNLVNTETSIISLEFKWIDYLGKISYSIYMFHLIVLMVVQRYITNNHILMYPLVFGITFIVSALSYEYFEKWFLSIKSRFAKIQSSSDANS